MAEFDREDVRTTQGCLGLLLVLFVGLAAAFVVGGTFGLAYGAATLALCLAFETGWFLVASHRMLRDRE